MICEFVGRSIVSFVFSFFWWMNSTMPIANYSKNGKNKNKQQQQLQSNQAAISLEISLLIGTWRSTSTSNKWIFISRRTYFTMNEMVMESSSVFLDHWANVWDNTTTMKIIPIRTHRDLSFLLLFLLSILECVGDRSTSFILYISGNWLFFWCPLYIRMHFIVNTIITSDPSNRTRPDMPFSCSLYLFSSLICLRIARTFIAYIHTLWERKSQSGWRCECICWALCLYVNERVC